MELLAWLTLLDCVLNPLKSGFSPPPASTPDSGIQLPPPVRDAVPGLFDRDQSAIALLATHRVPATKILGVPFGERNSTEALDIMARPVERYHRLAALITAMADDCSPHAAIRLL